MIDRRGVRLALNTCMGEGFRASVDPEDLEPVADATPLSRTVVTRQHRRHRLLTLPSGWVLFVCLFLPAMKLCDSGDPFPMVMVPFLWPPYLVGLVVALAAATRPDAIAGRGTGLFMLIRVSAVGLGGSMMFEMLDGQLGVEGLLVIVICIAAFAVTWRPPTEVAVAGVSVLAAGGSFAFTLALSLERLSVWGAHVAAIAAGVLALGTVAWFGEALWARRVARTAQTGCTSWR